MLIGCGDTLSCLTRRRTIPREIRRSLNLHALLQKYKNMSSSFGVPFVTKPGIRIDREVRDGTSAASVKLWADFSK